MQARHSSSPARAAQRGAALAISLIFLLVLTLVGVTAMSTTTMQERMAGNLRDTGMAFQAAESALAEAEAVIDGLAVAPNPAGCTSACEVWPETAVDSAAQDAAWWTANGELLGDDGTQELAGLDEDPRYTIREYDVLPDQIDPSLPPTQTYYYEITARGVGASSNAVAIVRGIVRKRFN